MTGRYRPYRVSALHSFHLAQGAAMVELGEWRVPRDYGTPQLEQQAMESSCVAIDTSPVQVIEILSDRLDEWIVQRFGLAEAPAVGSACRLPLGLLLRLRADRAFIRGDRLAEAPIDAAAWQAEDPVSTRISDLSHGFASISLLGPKGFEVLSMRCASLGHPDKLASGEVIQTGIAHVKGIVVRADAGSVPIYELLVDRQYGLYVWTQILSAVARFGGRPAGWATWSGVLGATGQSIPSTIGMPS